MLSSALRVPSRRIRSFSTTRASSWGPSRLPSLASLPIDISPEVAQAQAEGRAVVALESTLITHGLPPPHSVDLPLQCEEILRAQGVAPATIAIIDGRIKVGLSPKELAFLAEKGFEARKDGGKSLWKVGRRELGAAVVKRMVGGTTVSGTMAVAHLAGIKIFSTGGIGGVHRGAETSMTDLLSLPSSLLLGVPIPEDYHAAGDALQVAVEQAVRESEENGVSRSGKLATPWLLERVGQLTKGVAIVSNMALIRNNVKVGGEIALEYAKLLKQETPSPTPTLPTPSTPPPTPSSPPSLVVVGSLAIDLTLTPTSTSPLRTTAPGTNTLTLGGVGANVAGAARSIGIEDVLLVSPVADDLFGLVAKAGMGSRGMRVDGLVQSAEKEARTATCGILVDQEGELVGGVADMEIVAGMTGAQVIEQIGSTPPRVLCFDGNVAATTMSELLAYCQKHDVDTFFEPTSDAKALRVLQAVEVTINKTNKPLVSYATPNIHELAALYQHTQSEDNEQHRVYSPGMWFDSINVNADLLATRLPAWVLEEGVVQMAVQLLPVINTIFVKSGSRGVVVRSY
ncbi:hypothetical protein RQP46_002438 [Phenoliferia psychrophenolica]